MADTNFSTSATVIHLFAGEPLAQRFLDDPELLALAWEQDCADMTNAEIADMDEWVEYQMYLDNERINTTRG